VFGKAFAAAVRNYIEDPSDEAKLRVLRNISTEYSRSVQQQYRPLADVVNLLSNPDELWQQKRKADARGSALNVELANKLGKWLTRQIEITGAHPI
jgi:hypothetical protein